MREEMETVKNEVVGRDAKKRMTLELEHAKLKEKEAETKARLTLQSRAQQDELLMKYKLDAQNKESEAQQLRKT